MSKLKKWHADLLLLLTALVWGGTFVTVKEAVQAIPAEFIVAVRFSIAFLFLFLGLGYSIRNTWRASLQPGIMLGIILGVAFWAQTSGLKTTSPSTSAFITGLNVVFVAIIDTMLVMKFPKFKVWMGVAAATVGLLALTWTGSFQARPGDLLTLLCAILFGLHIVLTARWAPGRDPRALTLIQFAVVSLLAWAAQGMANAPIPALTGRHIGMLALLGLFPTAIAFLLQTIAQRVAPPIHTAIILSAEPVFAALFSLVLGMDHFTFQLVIGGGLIFIGTHLTMGEESPKELESRPA